MKRSILFLAAIALIISLSLPVFATEKCLCDEHCHIQCEDPECKELCLCQCHDEIVVAPRCITYEPDDVP